jgi:ubiquinone/menaquinone biosynthesis C-methylase UbiE
VSISAPPEPSAPPGPPRKSFRRLIEFKGIGTVSINQYKDKVRNLYDGPAGAVLALGSVLSLHEPLVGRMIRKRKFDVTRFGSILDIGSGAGQILRHLIKVAPDGTRIVACDLSHQMLRRARRRVRSARPTYVAADMTRLPFPEGTFDCVTCGYVIEHLPDPRPGLEEIGRVLKPGGSLLLLATEDTYSGAVVSRTWKCRTYNRDELRQSCEQSGLPWHDELWFTPVHRFFRMGGILVEAQKPAEEAPQTRGDA